MNSSYPFRIKMGRTIADISRTTTRPTPLSGSRRGGTGSLIAAGPVRVIEGLIGSGVGAAASSRPTSDLGRRSVAVPPSRFSTCDSELRAITRSGTSVSDVVWGGPDPGTVVGVGEGIDVPVRGGGGDGVSDGDGDGDGSSDGLGVGSGLGEGVSDGDGDGLTTSLASAESARPATASNANITAVMSCFFNVLSRPATPDDGRTPNHLPSPRRP